MGRRSEMVCLVRSVQASDAARERAKVMLLTLGGQWSVKDGYERLGMKRTRFQDLRRRMLEAAVRALEEGPVGRPRKAVEPECEDALALREQVADLSHALRIVRTQLDLAECGIGAVVRRRKEQQQRRSAQGRRRCRFESTRAGARRTGG